MQTENLLKEGDAAKRLGIAPTTLSRWRSKKRGPIYRKIGGAVRYAEADLAIFVEEAAVLGDRTP